MECKFKKGDKVMVTGDSEYTKKYSLGVVDEDNSQYPYIKSFDPLGKYKRPAVAEGNLTLISLKHYLKLCK